LTVRLTLVVRWSYGYGYLLSPDSSTDSTKPYADESSPLIGSSVSDTAQLDLAANLHSTIRSEDYPSGEQYEDFDGLDAAPAHRESLTSFPPLSIHSVETRSTRISIRIRSILLQVLSVMNPPLWAVVASVTIALLSPVQKELFFNADGFLHNSLFLAIDTAGAVAIPLILVSLGASLVKERDVIDSTEEWSRQVDPQLERRGIFLALFCRMAIVPILVFPLLIVVMYFGVRYRLPSPPF